ncbi:MAG: YbaY family lipoprotein [Parvularculaceae bacterium]
MQRTLLVALILAAGCTREAASPPDAAAAAFTVAGEVIWTADTALPDGALLRVTLLDVSRADAAAVTLSEATYPIAGRAPATFSLTATAPVDPRARLSVRAEISDGAALLFTSDTDTPVPPGVSAGDLSIPLFAVDPAPASGAGGTPVVPVPVAYRCGGESFGVAIEAGAAYVTPDGGDTVTLQKLSGGDSAPQSFTNGFLTVFFDGSDSEGLKLRLAHGRALAVDCALIE